MPHPTGPTNPNTRKLVEKFEKKKEKFYLKLAKYMSKPTRNKRPVNVTKIGKFAKDNESVAIPTKVLGSGEIKKPVKVYAISFSSEARKKIKSAGGECLSLEDVDKKARIII